MTLTPGEWQTIASAPKDGTPVMLWEPDDGEGEPRVVGFWSRLYGGWLEASHMIDGSGKMEIHEHFEPDLPDTIIQPTHWMRLPSPPAQRREQEQ